MLTPPLKVAHVALSLDVGGLERNIVNQIRQAPATGEQISVICLEQPGALAEAARQLGATIVCAYKKPGIRLDVLPRLRKILKHLQPDVVHTHQIGPLFYVRLAALGLKIPLIVHTEHGKEPYHSSRKLRMLGKFAARSAEIFYCLTRDMADAVIAAGIAPPAKVRVIANGIDFSSYVAAHDTKSIREELNIPLGAPVIGTIGRLTEIKRQDVLLRAFAIVRESIPAAHLLLVGDGPLKTDLHQLAIELGIDRHVHFAGYQSQTAPYMQAMSIFTLTSRSEGMPQSLLEASVAAIPAICSRVGGIPEVITHEQTGLLFESGDHSELATGLLKLLRDRQYARDLATAAQANVQATFSIQRMTREYHEHFLELLNSRQRIQHQTPLPDPAAPRAEMIA